MTVGETLGGPAVCAGRRRGSRGRWGACTPSGARRLRHHPPSVSASPARTLAGLPSVDETFRPAPVWATSVEATPPAVDEEERSDRVGWGPDVTKSRRGGEGRDFAGIRGCCQRRGIPCPRRYGSALGAGQCPRSRAVQAPDLFLRPGARSPRWHPGGCQRCVTTAAGDVSVRVEHSVAIAPGRTAAGAGPGEGDTHAAALSGRRSAPNGDGARRPPSASPTCNVVRWSAGSDLGA